MSLIDGLEHIVRENYPLAPLTSIKLGGNAAYFAEPTNESELIELVKRFASESKTVRLIGSGSNVLIPEAGVDGLVISLSAPAFTGVDVNGGTVTAGGGAKMVHLIATSVREGLRGLHNLVGIPGTVGGALHGNAGIHGFDIGSLVSSAKVITRDGKVKTRDKDSMTFSHRKSSLNELVILEATFELESESEEKLTKSMHQKWIVARAQQATEDQRTLYMFADHGGEAANEVIDRAGLKGASLGPVALSDRDSNYLVAGSDATVKDVEDFIQHVQDQVAVKIDVELQVAVQQW